MLFGEDTPLRPRNGAVLVVGIVARISGCQNQKELSLEDQADHCKEYVERLYSGLVEFVIIATKGKGESLNRPELAQIEKLLRARRLDLLVVEELSRLIRGGEATRLCGIAVDHGTRVLAPNDGIDTNTPTWESGALKASQCGVEHNILTSLRIKHKAMNRFLKTGANPGLAIFGYEMPPGGKSYDDMFKVDSATKIYEEWHRRLKAELNCTAVADWLNQLGIPLGPYCRSKKWDGAIVRRITRNPILKGKPWRGSRRTEKHYESGRRRSRKNPKGPSFYSAPHLAFFKEWEFDALNAALDRENDKYCREKNGRDPLMGVSRKRSRCPGKIARCWYCGAQYVWGGNGIADHMMCNGSRDRECWNSIGFDGALAATKLAAEISNCLYGLEGFEQQFTRMVAEAQQSGKDGLPALRADLQKRLALHEKAKANIRESIRTAGPHPLLKQQLDEIDAEERKLLYEKHALEMRQQQRLELPESATMLREHMQQEFACLAVNSYEFAAFIRPLVSSFHVYLVRLIDGGHFFSRAKVVLNLAGTFPDVNLVPELQALVTKQLTIDLWDVAPQREQIRLEAVRLAASGERTHWQIGEQTLPRATATAVGRALALQQRMLALGLSDPWVVVHAPPDDYGKLRRHKHTKYGFRPLEGFQRPEI